MILGLISAGFNPPKSLTIEEVEFLRISDYILVDTYTSPNFLKEFKGKNIMFLERDKLENFGWIFELNSTISIVSPGDVFTATTHFNIFMEARKRGVEVKVFHNSSIFPLAAVSLGLHIYKLGPPVSLPRFQDNFRPYSPYDKILKNKKDGLHTILILDTSPPLTLKEAIAELKEMEKDRLMGLFTDDVNIAVISKLGMEDETIIYGSIKRLMDIDLQVPLSLVIPGELHYTEEESLELFRLK